MLNLICLANFKHSKIVDNESFCNEVLLNCDFLSIWLWLFYNSYAKIQSRSVRWKRISVCSKYNQFYRTWQFYLFSYTISCPKMYYGNSLHVVIWIKMIAVGHPPANINDAWVHLKQDLSTRKVNWSQRTYSKWPTKQIHSIYYKECETNITKIITNNTKALNASVLSIWLF